MNTSPPTTNAFQSPQIIRISTYPRAVIDRKPDDQSLENVQRGNYLLYPSPPQASSTSSSTSPSISSATVPQIVNILNPLISTIALPNASAGGGMLQNAKKCTFHQQCLHIQHQHPTTNSTTTMPANQSQTYQQQSPLLMQQSQQVRISNQIPAVTRNSTQANRDAISSNVQPTFNAALLQDRYLLLDMVDGSSFYKCIDIQTQKILVCKVSSSLSRTTTCLFI